MNNYIIIDADKLRLRIEELESKQKEFENLPHNPISTYNTLQYESNIYKQLLSQSTPLIPEIEKSFDAGRISCFSSKSPDGSAEKQDYISNLKLDI